MASSLKNLSEFNGKAPDVRGFEFGIVVSEWNREVTGKLLLGAMDSLKKYGVDEEDIHVHWVPGSFELPLGAQLLIENTNVAAVICLGCVIQGETRHFDFICQGVANGIMQLNLEFDTPVIFGVLTTDNQEQAMERAGGKHGNKGDEAAWTAIKMVALKDELEVDEDFED